MDKLLTKQYFSVKNSYKFADLQNEDNYKCSGSGCTCKYLNNRTQYDRNQFVAYNQGNSTDYEKAMFKTYKKNPYK
jgi:hypothetical protein